MKIGVGTQILCKYIQREKDQNHKKYLLSILKGVEKTNFNKLIKLI